MARKPPGDPLHREVHTLTIPKVAEAKPKSIRVKARSPIEGKKT